MTKNMTRKGLALGSIAALVIGSLVGAAPAQASGSASIDAAFGTKGMTQNGILGHTFDLVAIATNEADLRFYVTGVSAASLDVFRYNSPTLTDDALDGGDAPSFETLLVAETLGELNVGFIAAVDGTTDDLNGKLDKSKADEDLEAVVINPKIAAGNLAQLALSLNGITETTTITITPFLDTSPRDGAISTLDTKGATLTLTFHKNSEITATTTLVKPLIGSNKLTAEVTLDKGINSASVGYDLVDGVLTSPVNVEFKENGTRIGSLEAADWDKDAAAWVSRTTNPVTVDAAKVFSAQSFVASATAGSNLSLGIGAAGTAATIVGPDLLSFKTSGNVALSASGNDAELKAGSGSVEVSTKITAVAGKALVGQTVTYTFTRSALRAAASITVDGKTLSRTSTPDNIKVDALTDADGVAKVTVNYTGFAATPGTPDKVTVGASVAGATAILNTAVEDMTAVAIKATAIVEAANIGAGATRAIAKGGSAAVELHLVDQFGQPITTERRIQLLIEGATGTVEATVIGSVVTSTGIATATVVDSSTAASGNYTLRANVQKKNTSGDWIDDEASVLTQTVVSFVMGGSTAATLNTTTAIAAKADETTYKNLQTVDMVSNDGRKLALGARPYGVDGNDYFELKGFVRAANGVGVAGVPVTITAAGAGFATGNLVGDVYSVGSITVYTSSTGEYVAWAFSNKAGKVDYTVTSGAASATTTAYFKSAARTAGKTLVIDAPASVVPGSTLVVKATLADKYGNPVSAGDTENVVVSYDGPGLPLSTPDNFVEGKLQIGVLLGANDSGTATVTVSVYLDTLKVSVQKTVTIGAAGVTTEPVASWTKNQEDGTIKVYAKNIVGQGKVQFMVNGEEIAWVRAATSADSKLREANGFYYLVRTVELVEGQKNVFEIYVDGERTTRTAYTY